MRLIRTILVPVLFLAAGGALGIVLVDWLEDVPAAHFLPLQMPPSDYSRVEALAWRQQLLNAHEARWDRAEEESSVLAERSDRTLTELAIQHPDLLADPDLSATAIALIHQRAERADTPQAREFVARLCLFYRWTPARLQPVAEVCNRSVQDHEALGTQVVTQKGPDGLLLISTEPDMGDILEAYLDNPYVPQSLYALALELDPDKHGPIAHRLYLELLQLDATRAAKLQSHMAKSTGVLYRAHDLVDPPRDD